MNSEVPHTPEQKKDMESATSLFYLALLLAIIGPTSFLAALIDFDFGFINTPLEKLLLGTASSIFAVSAFIAAAHKGADAHM